MIGVGNAKQYASVLEKPLSRGRQEVILSAFAFLFSELVQYNQTQVDNITELERRMLAMLLVQGCLNFSATERRVIGERYDFWGFYHLSIALYGKSCLERWLIHLRRERNMRMST